MRQHGKEIKEIMLYGWYSERQARKRGSVEYRLISGEIAQITEIHALPGIYNKRYQDMRFVGEIAGFDQFIRRISWGRLAKKEKSNVTTN